MSLPSIDVEELERVLMALLNVPSPTGFTDEVARWVCAYLENLGISYEMTRRGAIRARLPGRRRARHGPLSPISTRWALR